MVDARFTAASNAYTSALRAAERILEQTSLPGSATSTQSATGPSFMDMVGDSLKSAANMGYQSEQMATRALSGKADLADVVTAVANAETALSAVVTIRDRVINAYQDILKMPI